MFWKHSTFGKILIAFSYLFAALLFVVFVIATLFILGMIVEGKSSGGQPLKITDYLQCALGILWFWSSFAAVVGLIRLLHVFGSKRWCRVLAGYLCLLFPFGTVYGVLVFVYLGKQKDWSHAA